MRNDPGEAASGPGSHAPHGALFHGRRRSGFDPYRRSRQVSAVPFSRSWAMPHRNTFSVPPMGAFVRRYLEGSKASVDLFARDNRWATVTNDIDLATAADFHMDAEAFCWEMARQGRSFDLAIFDPPYSPRQITECYNGMGRATTKEDTQSAALYKRVRDALVPILTPDATVLSFGWNSNGMGKSRGFQITEIMLVAHGAAHNDTICIAERRTASRIEARSDETPSAAQPEGQEPDGDSRDAQNPSGGM
jgi:hypothetical protein